MTEKKNFWKDQTTFLYVLLAILYTTALIVSNIIAGKLWQAPFGLIFTTGVWLFPIVYIIGDVVPEVYGLAKARRLIMFGFLANLFAVAFFMICLYLPAPVFWTNQAAFEIVLGFTPRLLIASFVGYLVGTNANAWIMVAMKKLTGGRWLWTRTISSTIVGELLDSALFVSVAFLGTMPTQALTNMIFAMAGFKIIYEAIVTPITYLVIGWAKKVEGVV